MKLLTVIIFLLINIVSYGQQQKQVCFSFDDLPVVNYGIKDSTYQKDLFNKIVLSLQTNNVPAIGFVNEKKLYDDKGIIQYQVDLLRKWSTSELELGNHTFSHPDYNKVSFQYYTDDILKGEIIVKGILNEQDKQIKYFRHPFLHVGNTKARADSLNAFLIKHNYLVAPVTIDNADYLFALAYKRTKEKNDTALMNTIGHDYIDYMEKKLKYFEMQSNNMFGRDISQILLLHASMLNSDYLDSLIALYKANNYVFVSMDEALKDTAYKTEITVYGNWGISWIDKWALSAGKKGEFFEEDPETPDYIKKLAE
ncbi:MAG: polysaccharide deacetylase family protein [Saprospiraceae bacterium]|nr:polysaccharide deacetylase family protein [Saprospiraceae bacterium]MCB9325773.1 polysaccharide deacetylase family protein [Lewinellaceae bacterium]